MSEQSFERLEAPLKSDLPERVEVRVRRERRRRWTEASADVDTQIDLLPGDEVKFTGSGAIWAGVWLTEQNGPAGWSGIDHDPKFPLNTGPNAHPYALIGRYNQMGYSYIGTGLDRAPYPIGSKRRLFLRVNDDLPGNGTGAFTCEVQVWRAR